MPGYDFIGKTGTAQVVNDNGIGYSDSYVIRGLAGMFPGNDPKVILYTAVKSENCASRDIATMVQSIVKNTSKYLEIYDETKESTTKLEEYTIESFLNKNIESVTGELKSKGINYVVIGNGEKVVEQIPSIGDKINKIDKVFLLTNGTEIKMPNLTNYSLKDFLSFVTLANIPYKIEGNGFLVKQSIEEGTILNDESNLEVLFEAKY